MPDFDTLEQNPVGIRFQLKIVANMHGRDEETNFLCEFLAYAANPAQQFSVLRLVDQGDEPIPYFQPQNVERHHVRPAGFLRFTGRDGSGFFHLHRHFLCLTFGYIPSQSAQANRQQQENKIRHAGNQAEHSDNPRGQGHHFRAVEKLPEELLRKILGVPHTSHHHTGGN